MLVDTNTASQPRANHPPNLKYKAWDLSAGVSTLNVYRPPTPPLSEMGLEFAPLRECGNSVLDQSWTIPTNCRRAFAHEMVSAHLVDAIRDPSRVIVDLYNQDKNAGVNFPAQVTSHFASIFQAQDAIQQVSVTLYVICP